MVSWFQSLATGDQISLVGTALALFGLLLVVWQIRQASRAHRLNQEAQKHSLRPYVVVHLLPLRSASDTGRIGIKNYGATAARNIRLTFDPPLPRLRLDEIQKNSPSEETVYLPVVDIIDRVFGKPISVLAPGQRVECLYWRRRKRYDGYLAPKIFKSSPSEEAMNEEREARERAQFEKEHKGLSADGFSDETVAIVSYSDDAGNDYCERYGLSPAIFEGFSFIETKNTNN